MRLGDFLIKFKRFNRCLRRKGFTLFELLVVITIIGLLAALAVPSIMSSINRGKEAALKQNLQTMRIALDDYFTDKGRDPKKLEDLVTEAYLRKIPVDPLSGTTDTWKLEISPVGATVTRPANVHTTSTEVGSNGQAFNTW